MSQVSKAVQGYNTSVSAGANAATAGKYGKTAAAQQTTVDTLAKNMQNQANAIGQLVTLLPQMRFSLDGRPIDAKVSKGIERAMNQLRNHLTYSN